MKTSEPRGAVPSTTNSSVWETDGLVGLMVNYSQLKGVPIAKYSGKQLILYKDGAPYPADIFVKVIDSAHVKITFSLPSTNDNDSDHHQAWVYRRFQEVPRVLGCEYPRFARDLENEVETVDCFVVMGAELFDQVVVFIRSIMAQAIEAAKLINWGDVFCKYAPDRQPVRNTTRATIPHNGNGSMSAVNQK